MVRCASTHCPLPAQERTFATNEELMLHAQETRGLHPLCVACERVFRDRESYVQVRDPSDVGMVRTASLIDPAAAGAQHMDAKHAIYCAKCSRKYHSASALEQHFRASAHHPNCPRCGAGMENRDAVTRHIAEDHPKVRCCGVQMFKDELDAHYLNSMNHPQCLECNAGFETQAKLDEHRAEAHTEVLCLICNRNFATREELEQHERAPGTHPRCEFCNNAFKDTSSLIEHFSTTHLLEHLGLLAMKSASVAPSSPPTPASSMPITPHKSAAAPQPASSGSGSGSGSGTSTSPRTYSLAVGSERTSSRIFPAVPAPTSPTARLRTYAQAQTHAPTPPPPIAHDKRPVPVPLPVPAASYASPPATDPHARRSPSPSPQSDIADLPRPRAHLFTVATPPSSNGGSGAATPTVFPSAAVIAARAQDLLSAARRLHTPSPSRSSFAETPSGDLSDFRLLKGTPSPSPQVGVVGLPREMLPRDLWLGDREREREREREAQREEEMLQREKEMLQRERERDAQREREKDAVRERERVRDAGVPAARMGMGMGVGASVTESPMHTPMPARSIASRVHEHSHPHPYTNGNGNGYAEKALGHRAYAHENQTNGSDNGYTRTNGNGYTNDYTPGYIAANGYPTPDTDGFPNHKRRSDTLTTLVSGDTNTPSPPPLASSSAFYCRLCRADPCVDVTATACGHVFCNRCIVTEVKRTACCPVCNSAVLLFALLRLRVWE
ncbi:hypothetical protein DENSPDRAFT_930676 [Dentipellis sp. KUC8613]|nr:hypothetical protein DENSPDRAFT_930676 [Dentipellis sp. KUC8613]